MVVLEFGQCRVLWKSKVFQMMTKDVVSLQTMNRRSWGRDSTLSDLEMGRSLNLKGWSPGTRSYNLESGYMEFMVSE